MLSSSNVWALQKSQIKLNDPYAEFHSKINKIVEEIYFVNFLKVQEIQQKIAMVSAEASLSTGTDNSHMLELSKKLNEIEKERYLNLEKALTSYGAVPVSKETLPSVQPKSIPGDWQTGSDIFYWPETKEFSFYAWFMGNTPILDMWGDYDLLSMEMKNDNGWIWNNIAAMAVFNDKNMNPDLAFDVGEADKYHVVSGNHVSARSDFWNGCIFNIQDKTIQGMMFLNGLTFMMMEGWLQVCGNSRVNYVKADFEHNYKRHIFDIVAISGSNITDFNLNVSYSNEGGSWFRTSGSRVAEIPSGY